MPNAADLTEYLADDTLNLPPRIDMETAVQEILGLHTQNGGATFSLYFGDISGQTLFAVSLYPKRSVPVFDEWPLRDILGRFIRDNEDLLRDPRNCVGTWYMAESALSILDVSATLPDRLSAEATGRQYNQIAIFDLQAGAEIVTGGTGVELEHWPPEAERLPPLERGNAVDKHP